MLGGAGNDILRFGAGADVLDGGADTDVVAATGAGTFTLTDASLTVAGTSVTLVGMEAANLTGSAGDDTFNVTGWTGGGAIDGKKGTDTIVAGGYDFVLTNAKLIRDPAGTAATFKLTNVEAANLTAGAVGNRLDASAFTRGPVTLTGGAGNDTLIGGSGNDSLFGDKGDDSISGGAGDDALDGGDDTDTLDGGAGNDTAINGETVTNV